MRNQSSYSPRSASSAEISAPKIMKKHKRLMAALAAIAANAKKANEPEWRTLEHGPRQHWEEWCIWRGVAYAHRGRMRSAYLPAIPYRWVRGGRDIAWVRHNTVAAICPPLSPERTLAEISKIYEVAS